MKIDAVFTHDTDIPRLTEEIELVCYRTVQEALTNFAKHAKADHVEVTINYFQDKLYLVVKDNGIGFNNQDTNGRRGFGLLGITERDSTISPGDALSYSAQVLVQYCSLIAESSKVEELVEEEAGGVVIPPYLYQVSIDDLELTTRTHNCLKRAGITDVGQILDMDDKEQRQPPEVAF